MGDFVCLAGSALDIEDSLRQRRMSAEVDHVAIEGGAPRNSLRSRCVGPLAEIDFRLVGAVLQWRRRWRALGVRSDPYFNE